MTEETYEITVEEALNIRLAQAEVEKAALALQLAKERTAAVHRELAGKYSKYGVYELVGELNLESRQGTRRKATSDSEAVEEES